MAGRVRGDTTSPTPSSVPSRSLATRRTGGLTGAGWGGRRGACASSKRSWSSPWRRAVSAPTALRGTRPLVGALGRRDRVADHQHELGSDARNLAPFGIIASLPPMPTGMIGTPALAAT